MADTTRAEPMSSAEDPIETVVAEVIARLRHAADEPDATLTCNDVLKLVGPRSHVIAILMFSLLNLIPAPPGYNFVMALIIIAMSVSLLLGREMALPGALGRLRLPVKIVLKLLDALQRLATFAARISSPRWRVLTGEAALPVVAVIGVVAGIFMLPPIPLTNMLPSIGLAVLCVGILNHDGIVVLAGAAIVLIGIIISGITVWLLVILGLSITDYIEGEDAGTAAQGASGSAPGR
ncbi:exopolysaccharide biosynthesis protein [Devosia sp. ZB163]|uniref:exopolysaccharide biosynthesis protein n=1 Tax=Devosia sp. ZB163 TaxID=3025938 RepID=UPI00235F1BA7|nr:exopolysaccharide biosynthesis protein [Devosia sp. ZB163]MDC9823507.1 exopolysaccharide biosynthesis protein [Devosia sp. ZB163]